MPLVSVIIPVYNVERFVEECLRSVFSQTMRDFDVIIVDDCSTDSTMKIVRKVCEECAGDINVHLLSTGINSGVSVARNIGIDASKARFVYFVDSDDYISNDALKQMITVAYKYPQAQIVYGTASVFENSEYFEYLDIPSKKLPNVINNRRSASNLILRHCYLPVTVWNRLFLREWLNKHSLRFKTGILAQDTHINFYLARHISSIAFCKETTYYYRYHDLNVSNSRFNYQRTCEEWVLCDWTRHLSFRNLRAQLLFILHYANDSYLRHRGPDAPLPPVWRKIPGALLHWARLMRRYGKEIPKENNINQ